MGLFSSVVIVSLITIISILAWIGLVFLVAAALEYLVEHQE